ncbi:MAG: flagellar hook-basal body complex protein, partial [Firmicutes bacterium]|nr:flagellar hook-basal body complex protein [Bacillota bacterium]
MMRSMFAGVSGLKTHQVRMDIIGNNIANVNSAGYKSSRATFQDMLSQTMRAATAPTETRGGTNPQQIGLGVQLGSIDVKHTQGNTQSTGYITDLAIEGDGFFVLGHGDSRLYTRAGMFGLDNGTEGNLVSLVNGQRVLGYKADQDGNIDTNSALESLYISASETITPRATDTVYFAGNLDNRYSVGESVRRTVQIYDSRGREQTLVVDLTQMGNNEWEWDASWLLVSDLIPLSSAGDIENNGKYAVNGDNLVLLDEAGNMTSTVVATRTDGRVWTIAGTTHTFEFERALEDGAIVSASSDNGGLILTTELALEQGQIEFNSDGSFKQVTGNNTLNFKPENAEELEVELDFNQFTQYADAFTGKFLNQNGYTSGALESYAIDQNGVIVGSFSN